MTLEELACLLDEHLEYQFPDVDNNWMFSFASCEMKQGESFLLGNCGRGKTLGDARDDYLSQIRGNKLVFHAMSPEYRKEISIPNDIK
jgi:hypothetical protein